MYTGHFGLDEGSFHGKAEGRQVYVGPQQAAVLARLRTALALSDTLIAVTGPVGAGKTTLARHAIAEIPGSRIVIPIDRMRLAPDEVLEVLLARFNTSRQPKGTIQRVAAFRRLLQEQLAQDTRVFIVVEDAERVGTDALLELEALTATDSGDSAGANLVLMGSMELPALLATPGLARLRQRLRLRQAVPAFTASEVTGYMRHCLEVAGGVLEQIFEPGTTEIVWRYSGGVARVIDNLCEAVLEAAADAGLATILPEFLQEVAERCGLELPAEEIADISPDDAADVAAVDEDVASPEAAVDRSSDAASDVRPLQDGGSVREAFETCPPGLAVVGSLPPPVEEVWFDQVTLGNVPHDEVPPDAALPDGLPLDEGSFDDSSPDDISSEEISADEISADEISADEISADEPPLDEVLPELIQRFEASASAPSGRFAAADAESGGRITQGSAGDAGQPGSETSALMPADVTARSIDDIPTLSNSMRVSVLPVPAFFEASQRLVEAEVANTPAIPDRAPEPERLTVPLSTGEDPISEPGARTEPEGLAVDGSCAAQPGADSLLQDETSGGWSEPFREEPYNESHIDSHIDSDIESHNESHDESHDKSQDGLRDELRSEPAAEPAARSFDGLPGPWSDLSSGRSPDTSFEDASGTSFDELADPEATTGTEILSTDDDQGRDGVNEDRLLPDEQTDLGPDVATDVFVGDGVSEPELDALQAAIRAANAWQSGETENPADSTPGLASGDGTPAITLDRSLSEPAPEGDLDRWADELSKATSLEDISDRLAETLFGNEELQSICTAIRNNGAGGASAVHAAAADEPLKPAAPAPEAPWSATPPATAGEQPKTAGPGAPSGAFSMTMSQRIDMLNTLNKGKPALRRPGSVAEIVLGETPDLPAPGSAPEPIESQIDTAITQTRKVLTDAAIARLAAEDDVAEDKGSRGLFGLFRRSSKS